MDLFIPLQLEFRPVLPTIRHNVDYLSFESELLRIDQIIELGGVEEAFVDLSLKRWLASSRKRVPTAKEQSRFQRKSAQALRCIVLQQLLGVLRQGYGDRNSDSRSAIFFETSVSIPDSH